MKQLLVPEMFIVGEHYTNDQIHYALGVGNMGGIRPKLNSDHQLDFIVLITSTETDKNLYQNPYADRIEGDILTYTGAGLKGEQTVSGVNKRLLEQVDVPIPIFGFIKEAANDYKFIGFLFLLRHYKDFQLDQKNEMRQVLIFEFQIISDTRAVKPLESKNVFGSIYENMKSKLVKEDTLVFKNNMLTSVTNVPDDLQNIEKMRARMMTIDPYKFEVIIGELIKHVGFSNVHVTKKSGDGGIDINAILKNPISTDLKYLFQVKRWKHSVGRNEVANLRGSMGFNNQGVIISTSHFTISSIHEATSEHKTPINLIGMDSLYSIVSLSNFPVDKYL